jgi:apolipoprotein N-acyltransferase
VSIHTTTASPWPCRAAYFSAAVFIGASGSVNLLYGWQKGTDLPTSLVWAGVAGAVAMIFALAWPALIRSIEGRRWSAALISLVALVLAGTYSITAALGSAAGGRMNAATTETATTDDRKKAQDAYDTAKAELAAVKPTRTVGELEAMRAGWRRAYPNQPWVLEPELARSKRRADLEAKMDGATKELKTTGPPKVANSDAKALSRYMAAIGVDATPERLAAAGLITMSRGRHGSLLSLVPASRRN